MLTSSCPLVFLEEYELSKQLHPKENDLVFLVPERPKGEKRDVERNSIPASQDYQCAYVQKFRRSSVSKYLTDTVETSQCQFPSFPQSVRPSLCLLCS